MERSEILEKAKTASQKDEGQEYLNNKARRYGEVGLCAFFLLITGYKLAMGIPANDILAVIWAYVGVGYLSKYRDLKTSRALFQAICGLIAAFAFAFAYLLQTW